MLEYAFFSDESRRRFVKVLRSQGLEPTTHEMAPELLVALDESGLDDAAADLIEECYAETLELDKHLYDSLDEEPPEAFEGAGLTFNLSDGREALAMIPQALMAKLLRTLSTDEIALLVDAIVDATEHVDERSLCQRLRDGDKPRELGER